MAVDQRRVELASLAWTEEAEKWIIREVGHRTWCVEKTFRFTPSGEAILEYDVAYYLFYSKEGALGFKRLKILEAVVKALDEDHANASVTINRENDDRLPRIARSQG